MHVAPFSGHDPVHRPHDLGRGACSGSSVAVRDSVYAPGLEHFPNVVVTREGAAALNTDRFWRLAYRVGFRAARLWWRLRRPHHDGAVVAVWLGGRILAVQQSYRRNPSWPGGGIHRGEEPRDAARRELREELGLAIASDDLVFAREMVVDWDHRRDRVRVFELHLRAEPVIRIDNREIVAARFVDPCVLLAADDLPPFIRAYLGEARPCRKARPMGA